jgi:hypothetical protein
VWWNAIIPDIVAPAENVMEWRRAAALCGVLSFNVTLIYGHGQRQAWAAPYWIYVAGRLRRCLAMSAYNLVLVAFTGPPVVWSIHIVGMSYLYNSCLFVSNHNCAIACWKVVTLFSPPFEVQLNPTQAWVLKYCRGWGNAMEAIWLEATTSYSITARCAVLVWRAWRVSSTRWVPRKRHVLTLHTSGLCCFRGTKWLSLLYSTYVPDEVGAIISKIRLQSLYCPWRTWTAWVAHHRHIAAVPSLLLTRTSW